MEKTTVQEKREEEISDDVRLIKESKRESKADRQDSAYSFNN